MSFTGKAFLVWLVLDILIAYIAGYFVAPRGHRGEATFVFLCFIWGGLLFFMVRNGIHGFINRKIFKNAFEDAIYQVLKQKNIPFSPNGYGCLKEFFTSTHPCDYFSEILLELGHSLEDREAAQYMIGLCHGYEVTLTGKPSTLAEFHKGVKLATIRHAEDKKYELYREELHP